MKVIVKRPFFDNNGLHRVDDVVDVEVFDANLMEVIEEEKKPIAKKVSKKD